MPTREEIKAEIMSKLEKVLDEALESGKKPLTLTEIEDLALGAGGRLEEEITSGLLEQQTGQLNPQIPECPECGGRMHRKGTKKRYLRSRSGETEIERPYFYCKTCRKGHFPP
jgi:YgiT-type zinc finger domain-containing protein